MLNILKWVYKLGYEEAERKYYHALRARILAPDDINRELEFIQSEELSKFRKRESEDRLKLNNKLNVLIDDVFGKVQKAEVVVDPLDRFWP